MSVGRKASDLRKGRKNRWEEEERNGERLERMVYNNLK